MPLLPSRVIDVGTHVGSQFVKLLLSTPGQRGEYTCLSYCWGGPQAVTLTRATREALQGGIPVEKLGQTIRDAIDTTRVLGFRFLWVDALCIIQDDYEDKVVEIDKMASIYKNAVVTIAAATATSSYEGFLSRERTPPQRDTCGFQVPMINGSTGSCTLMVCRNYIPSEPINTRAWTMQEYVLSTRMLLYSDVELLWECQTEGKKQVRKSQMTYYDLSQRARLQNMTKLVQSNNETKHWDWAGMVQEYSQRSLTEPEDKLIALAGVAHEVELLLKDEYIFGMWKQPIIEFLGWWSVKQQTRRSKRAPSWSWACLDGGVEFAKYAPVAKCIAFDDSRGLVVMCQIFRGRITALGKDINLSKDLVNEKSTKKSHYMLLGDMGPGSDVGVALILIKIGTDYYKRTGMVFGADRRVWGVCGKRRITIF
jgi:Heterokaryon incompatibility protein (HET)